MKNKEKLAKYFKDILGEGNVIPDAPMSQYTTFKAGGASEMLLIIGDEEKLSDVLKILEEENITRMLLGVGSNVLVKDGGFDGVFLKLADTFKKVKREGEDIVVGAATKLSTAAAFARDNSLSGMEFACGIPGSMGGGVFMNAGAYDGELCNIIKSVRIISKNGDKIDEISLEEANLSYRYSRFQETGEVILSARLGLKKGNKAEIAEKMQELMNRRNTKQPVKIPSAGSFFKRPSSGYASRLIEEAGLKGKKVGDAQVSPLHSGFIVNNGNASTSEIIQLMQIVQEEVDKKFGIKLYPEVRIVGRD